MLLTAPYWYKSSRNKAKWKWTSIPGFRSDFCTCFYIRNLLPWNRMQKWNMDDFNYFIMKTFNISIWTTSAACINKTSINQSLISGIFCAEWREQILGVGSWCDCSDRHLIKNQNEIGNTAEAGNSWSSTATWGVWEFTTNSQDSTTNRAVFSLCVKLQQ